MIEVAKAMELLEREIRPLAGVEVALERAQGHVLFREVRADRDFPPTSRSAMDGFAVRTADLPAAEVELEVAGELRAGQPAEGLAVGPGQAVRVMTGAVIPRGADAVVMVEHTRELPGRGRVTIYDRPSRGQHIRRRGEDLECGELVLEPGTPIHAPEIAALSAVGLTRVQVHRTPVVHVLSTGDEVVEPDRVPLDHQIRNSNAGTLLALLRELEIEGRYLGIAPDDRGRLDDVLRQGLTGDVLLVTGGISAGQYDLVGDALDAAGMRLLFHKVAIKPGKPILAGRRGPCLVIGLPGNPVSAYAGFAIFAAPVLRRMRGYTHWKNLELSAVLEAPLSAKPERQTYHLARLSPRQGRLSARPVPTAGSGDVLSLSRANGFLVTPFGCRGLDTGDEATVLVWRDFHLRH